MHKLLYTSTEKRCDFIYMFEYIYEILCVDRIKFQLPARVGQSHPVLLLLLLESQCQSEKRAINERKSAASRKECRLKKTAAPSLPRPLLLSTSVLNYQNTAQDLIRNYFPHGNSNLYQKLKAFYG